MHASQRFERVLIHLDVGAFGFSVSATSIIYTISVVVPRYGHAGLGVLFCFPYFKRQISTHIQLLCVDAIILEE